MAANASFAVSPGGTTGAVAEVMLASMAPHSLRQAGGYLLCMLLGYLFGAWAPIPFSRSAGNLKFLNDLVDASGKGCVDDDEMERLAVLILRETYRRGRWHEVQAEVGSRRAWCCRRVWFPASMAAAAIALCYFFGLGYSLLVLSVFVLALPAYCAKRAVDLQVLADRMTDVISRNERAIKCPSGDGPNGRSWVEANKDSLRDDSFWERSALMEHVWTQSVEL